jgi:amino acid adenylation domain-containing protein
MFEAQAERTPDAMAVTFEGASVTYRELNERANQLARHLQTFGSSPKSFCGICVERSIEMLVGVLAILKTGAAYVPLDPAYPVERLAFMLEDTRMPVLLTQRGIAETLKGQHANIITLEDEWHRIAQRKADGLNIGAAAQDPAYVIFTSGSTGRPKGVLMGHGALANLLRWQLESSRLAGDGRKTVQFASLSFDVSFQEMFSTWCAGGTLVLIRDELRRDVRRLWEVLAAEGIERLFLPPVVLQHLAVAADKQGAAPTSLREIITAGEQLKITPQIRQMFARLPGCTLHNQYGPSESHVVTGYRLAGDAGRWMELPPIGRPITNAEIHVLDEHLQPVETGIAGELYIGGVCLAHGYLNRPELTDKSFIPNPFRAAAATGGDGEGGAAAAQARLYRTGDLARRLPDGNVEFLGRVDHQVKIHGYRIEAGEVEAALLRHEAVREAVVTAREDARSERQLVAYLVGDETPAASAPSVTELRDFLRASLPEFMIPSAFVYLDSLPLTPNGKIDRAALPALGDERPNLGHVVAPPSNPVEARLKEIWERVLNVRPVGVKDNFFELGGHSLLAVAMLIEIKEAFGRNLPASTLIGEGTIERLARTIAAGGEEPESSTLVAIQPTGSRPPLFFLHPIGGEVFGYAALARHLGADQPFYGIQARGLDGRHSPFHEMTAMAAFYVEEVRRVWPTEPFLLGGYSLGGVIAFEMAQQLYSTGYRQIEVLIVDEEAPLPGATNLSATLNVARNFPHWFQQHVARRPARELLEGARRNLFKLGRRVRQALGGGAASSPEAYEVELADVLDLSRLTETHRRVCAALYEALSNYEPRVYPGRLTLLRTRAQTLFSASGRDKGWTRLAAEGVDVKVVRGNHRDVYEEPNAATLAREIEAFLRRTK